MANMREHLAKMHRASQQHENNMSILAKAAGRPDESEQHKKMAAYHEQACEECEKLQGDDIEKVVADVLGKTLVPDKLSAVGRRDTDPEPFGIRKVIRPGQPEQPVDTTNVPIEFRHLVSTGE